MVQLSSLAAALAVGFLPNLYVPTIYLPGCDYLTPRVEPSLQVSMKLPLQKANYTLAQPPTMAN